MIIHLLQHIIFTIIVLVIIALVIQMTVHHHLQIQEDVMAVVAGEIKKSPFMQRAFDDLR
ncbi:histidine kinase [Acinetobacter pittii]|nr:histidine kinase [Acinetobacter pittii]PTV47158.1 histidine kinase [Acinetobacter pittii]